MWKPVECEVIGLTWCKSDNRSEFYNDSSPEDLPMYYVCGSPNGVTRLKLPIMQNVVVHVGSWAPGATFGQIHGGPFHKTKQNP